MKTIAPLSYPFLALSWLWTQCLPATGQGQVPLKDKSRPNFLFVLTDDQDAHLDSLSYMPLLQKHLVERGTQFSRHYCTVALCCPSRASLWTGKAAHNTNVTDVNPPHGGYPKFISQGFNDHYLPVWLQDAGYGTYYVGKLFNAQTVNNYNSPHAAGWSGSDFLLDPYTYRYLNATFQRNHDPPRSYEGHYSTDVVAEKAHGFLEDALQSQKKTGQPFFITVAPTAPHSDVNIKQKVIHGNFSEHTNVQSPPVPAERHRHLFQDVVVPRTPHFNPDRPSGASWISHLPKQNDTNVEFNDHFYRNRLRALQSVDEMVESLIMRLEDAAVLDNTYVFFSTDNGYHIGQHRLQPGKQCAFEEDINIPLIVRGPGFAEGTTRDLVTTHTDLAPTFLKLAGMEHSDDFGFDGAAIPLASSTEEDLDGDDAAWRQEHVNVEMWGIIMSEGIYGSVLHPNHTYKALRVVGDEYSLLYTVWCSGEHELYNLKEDAYEMHNLFDLDHEMPPESWQWNGSGAEAGAGAEPGLDEANSSIPLPDPMASPTSSNSSSLGVKSTGGIARTPAHLIHRLDGLLMVLKTCKGRQCTHPWESLHPRGDVLSLADALEPEHDPFYDRISTEAKVGFQRCEKGYIPESELPTWHGEVGERMAYGMFEEVAAE